MATIADEKREGLDRLASRRTTGRLPAIAYDDVGAGPAIVLVHGGWGHRSYFTRQIEYLRPDHRVIALDLRGHGESDASRNGAYMVRNFADDIIAVCDSAGVANALICGHSVSGAAALEVAARRPELVSGVVLLDAVVLFPEAVRTAALMDFIPRLEGPQWLDALRAYFTRLMFSPFDPPAMKDQVLRDLADVRPEIGPIFMRDLMSSDHAEYVASGAYPLLYMHGSAPADLTRLRQLRPDALVTEVIGSGHFVMLSAPDVVSATLDRFLGIVASHT